MTPNTSGEFDCDNPEFSATSTFKLRRRTPGSFLLVPSLSDGRSIRCQGQLEGRAALILGASPVVTRITEQPLKIWYEFSHDDRCEVDLASLPTKRPGIKRRYTVPDFLVEVAGSASVLIEVKPSDRLSRLHTRRKLAAAAHFAKLHGWTRLVLTEKELSPEPLTSNIRRLIRYRSGHFDGQLLASLKSSADSHGTTIDEFMSAENNSPFVWHHVMHLLATAEMTGDLVTSSINSNFRLYPKGAIQWDPFASVWAPSGMLTGSDGK